MLVNIYLAEKEMEAHVEDSLDQLAYKQLIQEAKGDNASAIQGLLNAIAISLGQQIETVSNSVRTWFVKPVEER
jgi:hypothetical protein